MSGGDPPLCEPGSPQCANLRRQWTEFCAANGSSVNAECAPGFSRVCLLLSALRLYRVAGRDRGA